MNTLIFKAPRAMSAPLPGTPVLPVFGEDYDLALFASDFVTTHANGAPVVSALARGRIGTEQERSFVKWSGWNAPVLHHEAAPGGKPALVFDGNSAMRAPLYLQSQPMTTVIMVRIDSYTNAGNTTRIFGGFEGNLHNLDVRPAGKIRMRAAGTYEGGIATDGPAAGEWAPIVAVFDGVRSKIKVGLNAIQAVEDVGAESALPIYLGVSGGFPNANGFGLKGAIAELRRFNRAFSNEEIDALAANMYQKYAA
ncbi:LamG-like jellyroll fold domain-containing protein [Massilia timonae]|uniref:LamG-like jellyroll fold domain-containing protein n=1 Tax=Massilia timonae TaxID=47229 RepID=UPI0028D51427|nr:LamG-like jellyroll fold domain-containing protein [Massilia timonae]